MVKGKNTKPELIVRKFLWNEGYRYRLHYKNLPGKPDIVFPGRRKVIFIHGCFWHRHDCKFFSWPRSNEDFWKKKILANVERDRKNKKILVKDGWVVMTIWECETRPNQVEKLWPKIESFVD